MPSLYNPCPNATIAFWVIAISGSDENSLNDLPILAIATHMLSMGYRSCLAFIDSWLSKCLFTNASTYGFGSCSLIGSSVMILDVDPFSCSLVVIGYYFRSKGIETEPSLFIQPSIICFKKNCCFCANRYTHFYPKEFIRRKQKPNF